MTPVTGQALGQLIAGFDQVIEGAAKQIDALQAEVKKQTERAEAAEKRLAEALKETPNPVG